MGSKKMSEFRRELYEVRRVVLAEKAEKKRLAEEAQPRNTFPKKALRGFRFRRQSSRHESEKWSVT
jgi:hypothetical protein